VSGRSELPAIASGKGSVALGNSSAASGDWSIAGPMSGANGLNSVAFGGTASATYAIAIGSEPEASADYAVAIGRKCYARGKDSIAMGPSSVVTGEHGMAFGLNNKVNGSGSMAFGYNNVSSGNYAAAIGHTNQATGYAAAAFNYQNQAKGMRSAAFGRNTIAAGHDQAVFGRFNAEDTDALFIVGNGSADNKRSNALTLSNDGVMSLEGHFNGTTANFIGSMDVRGGLTIYNTDISGHIYFLDSSANYMGEIQMLERELLIGNCSVASPAYDCVAIGLNASIGAVFGAVSIGQNTLCDGEKSVSIGTECVAGPHSVSIGNGCGNHAGSVAIGSGAKSAGAGEAVIAVARGGFGDTTFCGQEVSENMFRVTSYGTGDMFTVKGDGAAIAGRATTSEDSDNTLVTLGFLKEFINNSTNEVLKEILEVEY
jgi:hypothetical protein